MALVGGFDVPIGIVLYALTASSETVAPSAAAITIRRTMVRAVWRLRVRSKTVSWRTYQTT
jgi:hypothetical protein